MTNQELLECFSPYLPYNVRFVDTIDDYTGVMMGLTIDDNNVIEVIGNEYTHDIDSIKLVLRPCRDIYKDENITLKLEYYNLLKDCYYKSLSFLYKNHFDCHGLIDNGCAIDINTLPSSDS